MPRSSMLCLAVTRSTADVFAEKNPTPAPRLWSRQAAENWLQAQPLGDLMLQLPTNGPISS